MDFWFLKLVQTPAWQSPKSLWMLGFQKMQKILGSTDHNNIKKWGYPKGQRNSRWKEVPRAPNDGFVQKINRSCQIPCRIVDEHVHTDCGTPSWIVDDNFIEKTCWFLVMACFLASSEVNSGLRSRLVFHAIYTRTATSCLCQLSIPSSCRTRKQLSCTIPSTPMDFEELDESSAALRK